MLEVIRAIKSSRVQGGSGTSVLVMCIVNGILRVHASPARAGGGSEAGRALGSSGPVSAGSSPSVMLLTDGDLPLGGGAGAGAGAGTG